EITYRLKSISKGKAIYYSVLNRDDVIEYSNGIYIRNFSGTEKYNRWGQLNEVSSGGGTFVTLSFEESGRLDRGVLPDGRVLQFSWDPSENKISSIKFEKQTV